jgi:hypothetical protein
MTAGSLISLEAFLTGRGYADLAASPLQLAIARAADGRDLGGVLAPAALKAHFGVDELPPSPGIALVCLICGVRSGKSFMAACAVLKAALTADLSKLKAHEVPRCAIVAPTVDNADQTFSILAGIVSTSPILSRLVVKQVEGELLIRRLDGRTVEIVVVAAHRGATTLRSRWLAGFVLEEAALFGIEIQGAAVTAEEVLRAGEPRLLPGTQGWIISSPFGPEGLLWNLYRAHFGKPARVLVVHGPTLAMNPSFDPATIEEIRKRDPDTAAREFDAQWLDASASLLGGALVDACMRQGAPKLDWREGYRYSAFMDPASRGNAWTLVIATRDASHKTIVVLARQWVGSKTSPLSPKAVLSEIARLCGAYNTQCVVTDQYSGDAYREIAREFGLLLIIDTITEAKRNQLYLALAVAFADGTVEIPADPLVRSDLLGIKKLATQNAVTYRLLRTPDGRHCDFAQPLAMAVAAHIPSPARRGSACPGSSSIIASKFANPIRNPWAPTIDRWTW